MRRPLPPPPARRRMVPRPFVPTPPPVPRTPLLVVPKLWPGSTVVCLGGGPSLTQADVNLVRGRARVIAINDAYRLAPWADVLYACDNKWWQWHKGARAFAGLKYALQPQAAKWPGVQVLQKTGTDGLETAPTGLRTGNNSGFQAINLAVHLGATRIVLLGYDMQGGHWFGKHPDGSAPPFQLCLRRFETLVGPLKAAGVEVLNCTRKTALRCFARVPLEQVITKIYRDELYAHNDAEVAS